MWSVGFYKIAWDLDVPVDFVHDEFITAHELSKYEILLVPYQPIITNRTAKIFKEYVENDGKIIAEASLGRFKDHGWKAGDAPHGMQDVFGCATRGIYAKMAAPFSGL